MQRTELHFIIDQEGYIQSIVKGVKGSGCKILIEDIKKLGQAVHESPTGEFYERELDSTAFFSKIKSRHQSQPL